MKNYRCARVWLRLFMALLFCGGGYGLTQLPALVTVFRQAGEPECTPHREASRPSTPAATKKRPAERSGMPPEAASVENPGQPALLDLMENHPVYNALRAVRDPELGVSIIDLGMIRDIAEEGTAGLVITMLPTSPLCPYLKYLVAEIRQTARPLAPGRTIKVVIDMQHRWTPEYLSTEGQRYFFGGKP